MNDWSSSDADIAKAVAYGKRVKFYPLSQAGNPSETKPMKLTAPAFRLSAV